MLGGANAFCNVDFGESRSEITKGWENLPFHLKAKVEYDLHFFSAETGWDDEEMI